MIERPFSVYGYWPHNTERYGEVYRATSARAAEDLARMQGAEEGLTFQVAGVFEGELPSVDRHTLYVDPRDVRNADVENLVPDVDELEISRWTVLGLILSNDPQWNNRTGGQRYCDHVWAMSPLAAEDVAVSKVRDEGGQLLVCAEPPARSSAPMPATRTTPTLTWPPNRDTWRRFFSALTCTNLETRHPPATPTYRFQRTSNR